MNIAVACLLAASLAIPAAPATVATMPAPAAGHAIPAEPTAAVVAPAQVPANTVVELELVDPVGSRTSRPDDLFALRVVSDVSVGGQVLIPAGSVAVGQVVHAQKAGGGGKAGELILAARHVDTPLGRIRLRSTFGAAGAHHTVASLVTAQFIGPFAMAVRGGEILLAPGTRMVARTAPAMPSADSPATAVPVPAAAATPPHAHETKDP
jgi:hypothetical protein